MILIYVFAVFIISVQFLFWSSTRHLIREIRLTTNILPHIYVPFSVLISARNEGPNLTRFLTVILRQDYPTFEVIIIDDDSTDDSAEILNQYKESNRSFI